MNRVSIEVCRLAKQAYNVDLNIEEVCEFVTASSEEAMVDGQVKKIALGLAWVVRYNFDTEVVRIAFRPEGTDCYYADVIVSEEGISSVLPEEFEMHALYHKLWYQVFADFRYNGIVIEGKTVSEVTLDMKSDEQLCVHYTDGTYDNVACLPVESLRILCA